MMSQFFCVCLIFLIMGIFAQHHDEDFPQHPPSIEPPKQYVHLARQYRSANLYMLPQDCSSKSKSLTLNLNWQHGMGSQWNSFIINAGLFALSMDRTLYIVPQKDWIYSCASDKTWDCYFLPTTTCPKPNPKDQTHYRYDPEYSWQMMNRTTKFKWVTTNRLLGEDHVTVDCHSLYGSRILEGATYLMQWKQLQDVLVPHHLHSHDQLTACLRIKSVVAQLMFRFQPAVERSVADAVRKLDLPAEYYGVIIRRGDKILEHALPPAQEYWNALKAKAEETDSIIQTIFVAGDDYRAYEEFEEVVREECEGESAVVCGWQQPRLVHYMDEKFKGFVRNEWLDGKMSYKKKYELTLIYFTQLTILRAAIAVIGSYGNNSFRLLKLLREAGFDTLVPADELEWNMQQFSIV